MLQERGVAAVRSADLARTHRERLVRHGFLQPVIKGWYVAASPGQGAGDSTAWYASFQSFCAGYLGVRFGAEWCLSPEQSLALHAGNRTVPRQLLVRAPKGRNQVTPLPHGTSLLEVRAALPPGGEDVVALNGMRAFSRPAALIACPARFFRLNPVDARTALALVPDASALLRRLLDGGHGGTVAGRLAAAFRSIGRERVADDIAEAMRAADFSVRERDPFETPAPALALRRDASPMAQRIRLMWDTMRGPVLDRFPAPPGRRGGVDAVLEGFDRLYATDAYHSLSIEGYRVSPALIERVRGGAWNPARSEEDRAHRDAMPAFLDLPCEEPEPSVRTVLGHFLFVYVHPCPDGNGRIGRFLMNVMLAAGGYPWTVIPVERRDDYMAALEDASVRGEIGPLTGFLAGLVRLA